MRYPPYPRYKPSEIEWLEEVPAHWEERKLCSIFEVKGRIGWRGYTVDDLADQHDGVLVLGATNIDRIGRISLDDATYLSRQKYEESPEIHLYGGELLVVKVGATIGKVGLVPFWDKEATINPNVMILRRRKPDNRFFHFQFQSEILQALLSLEKMAGAQEAINQEFVKSLKLLTPPENEQVCIADFLDQETARLDRLIAKKCELIVKLKEKRTALISRTVTRGLPPHAACAAGLNPDLPLKPSRVAWLGRIPAHWATPPLYVRYSVELGKMLNENKITGSNLIPYLRNVDVQWDHIDFDDLPEMDILPSEYQRYTISEGDLLVCEGGEVGRATVVGRVSSVIGFQKALHRLRALTPEEYPRFLFYTLYWAANTGVFNAGGISTIAHLTNEQLRRYRFPMPPYLEQSAITEYLDRETGKIGCLIKKVEVAIKCLQEYRTALITAAVTGKIDVRDLSAANVAKADDMIPFSKAMRISGSP